MAGRGKTCVAPCARATRSAAAGSAHAAVRGAVTDEKYRLIVLRRLVNQLPTANYDTVGYLLRFLHRVASISNAANKMNTDNLAIVFSPSLLSPAKPSMQITPAKLIEQSEQTAVVECLIRHAPDLFPQSDGTLTPVHDGADSWTLDGMPRHGAVVRNLSVRRLEVPRFPVEEQRATMAAKTAAGRRAATRLPTPLSSPAQPALQPIQGDDASSGSDAKPGEPNELQSYV